MKSTSRFLLFTLLLVIMTAACKYFLGPDPAWSGFSPVIAIALFAGFIFRRRDFSFLLPLLALFLSDVVIHFLYKAGYFDYAGFYGGQWKNYLLLLSVTLLGWFAKGRSYSAVFGGAVAAPTVYFIVSNFMVWMGSSEVIYARTFSGLMTCYEMALPFYRNSLAATLVLLPVIILLYNRMGNLRPEMKLA